MRKILWLSPALLLASCVAPKRVALAPPAAPHQQAESDGDAGAELLRVFNDARTPPGGELRTETYLAAKDHIDRMHSVSLGTWTSLGPSTIGGRTRSLIIHPTNPNIMYAGA